MYYSVAIYPKGRYNRKYSSITKGSRLALASLGVDGHELGNGGRLAHRCGSRFRLEAHLYRPALTYNDGFGTFRSHSDDPVREDWSVSFSNFNTGRRTGR